MVNPVKADAESLALGKELWSKHCQSCHGKSGKGDGSKAAQLKTQPEDLGKPDIQKQPDGAFFYKTLEGREDMPSFKRKFPTRRISGCCQLRKNIQEIIETLPPVSLRVVIELFLKLQPCLLW
jgi:hypothetical protein